MSSKPNRHNLSLWVTTISEISPLIAWSKMESNPFLLKLRPDPEQAGKIYRVNPRTLVIWANRGDIKSIRTKGGHRRYLMSDIISKTGGDSTIIPSVQQGKRICYCRVSTRNQIDDLQRQIEFFQLEFPDHSIIKDIGSDIAHSLFYIGKHVFKSKNDVLDPTVIPILHHRQIY
jgi:hypothetical protein